MDTRVPRWTPYCGDAPEPTHWLVHWNFDPVLMTATFCLLVLGICRSPLTTRNQAAAAAIVLILFVSPLCALGSALFSIRAAHHLALALVLSPVLEGALPDHTRFRLPLAAATIVQAALLWVWHVPAFYEGALSNDALFWAMQVSITTSAMIWWIALRRASPLAAVASVLATMVQMGLLGALLVFAGRPLYAPHWLTTSPWGLTPLEDQQVAGLIMWVAGSGAYLALAGMLLWRALAPTARLQPA